MASLETEPRDTRARSNMAPTGHKKTKLAPTFCFLDEMESFVLNTPAHVSLEGSRGDPPAVPGCSSPWGQAP